MMNVFESKGMAVTNKTAVRSTKTRRTSPVAAFLHAKCWSCRLAVEVKIREEEKRTSLSAKRGLRSSVFLPNPSCTVDGRAGEEFFVGCVHKTGHCPLVAFLNEAVATTLKSPCLSPLPPYTLLFISL